jgi:5-amino-6-(5-phospho-D-ribitylamino)uracil phosphatase
LAERRAYDLLATDLDGTLLGTQHTLPVGNRAALHRAHEAGIKIVLCTGRSFTETRPILTDIGLDLDATVTVSGALVSDARTGRTLERTALPAGLAADVTGWFAARRYAVLWLIDRDQAGFDGYALDGAYRHEAFDRWLERAPVDVRAAAALPADYPPLRITIIDEIPNLERVGAALRATFGPRLAYNILRVPAYGFAVVETFAPEVNKWYGILKLCRRWGIDPARTVTVGDDVNDVDMIRSAGLGVAMANAQPVVKDVARRMTVSNDECGVARLIDELLGTPPVDS